MSTSPANTVGYDPDFSLLTSFAYDPSSSSSSSRTLLIDRHVSRLWSALRSLATLEPTTWCHGELLLLRHDDDSDREDGASERESWSRSIRTVLADLDHLSRVTSLFSFLRGKELIRNGERDSRSGSSFRKRSNPRFNTFRWNRCQTVLSFSPSLFALSLFLESLIQGYAGGQIESSSCWTIERQSTNETRSCGSRRRTDGNTTTRGLATVSSLSLSLPPSRPLNEMT